MPAIDSPDAGRRSISFVPKQQRRPDPEWIAAATSMAEREARMALATAVSAAAEVNQAAACDLIAKALPLLERIPAADRRTLAVAAVLRELGSCQLGSSRAATTAARRALQLAGRLGAEIAAETVKKDTELRAAVGVLAANPQTVVEANA